MLAFSLKFALRHLWKNKLFTAIKIIGLALGMVCVLLSALFIRDENNFDNFHEKAAHLYRITTTNNRGGSTTISGSTSQVQGPAFKSKIPEVLDYVRIWSGYTTNITIENKSFAVDVMYADNSFFNLFTFPLLSGNPSNVLKEINSIVLSEETARKIFGKTDVAGKTLKFEGDFGTRNFMVTGVIKSLPNNSSLHFEAIVPFQFLQTTFNDPDWLNAYVSTFVLLHPQSDIKKVEADFARIFREEAGEQLRKAATKPTEVQYRLQHLSQVHLSTFNSDAKVEQDNNIAGESLTVYSYILAGIALFMLIMATVNFLNLSIATLIGRHREMGMRKICGSSKRQLILQLSTEAALVCCIAYCMSLALLMIGLPIFNQLIGKNIQLSIPGDFVYLIGGFLLLTAFIILIGIYPAIKLSITDSVKLLQDNRHWNGKAFAGRALIVLQFACAIGLVFASIIYYRQMNFISGKDLGFNPQRLMQINIPPARSDSRVVLAFRDAIKQLPSVSQVTNGGMYDHGMQKFTLNEQEFKASVFHVDESYLPVLGIKVEKGRNFSTSMSTDSQAMIVNESFVKQSGWKDLLLQQIKVDDGQPKTIIGMISNYHTGSLKNRIHSQVIMLGNNDNIILKIREGRVIQALSAIEKTFKKFFPEHYYQFSFLEDVVNNQYVNEQRWKKIISYATGMAILICCIGLFGLAHFAALKRTKEIGIRKVLGATAFNILEVILEDFLKPVLLSAVMISPVAWYVMNRWLEDFSYRITINWFDILLTIFAALLIAVITVGSRVIRMAFQSPVKSLRTL